MTILEIEDLTVRYNPGTAAEVVALSGTSLVIRRGERVAVVGESGSGKTTLGMTIAGFTRGSNVAITSKCMEFEGRPITNATRSPLPRRVPGVAVVFQDAMSSLDPVWRVKNQLLDVIRAGGSVKKSDAIELARVWLARVGLPDIDRVMNSRPYELSGGMRQRVMLAVALCGSPRLLIADEPTSALDASLSREVMEVMSELTTSLGTSVLMITHDIHLSVDFADTTIVMRHGRIVERAASATLESSAEHPYTIGLLECVPTLDDVDRLTLPTLTEIEARTAA